MLTTLHHGALEVLHAGFACQSKSESCTQALLCCRWCTSGPWAQSLATSASALQWWRVASSGMPRLLCAALHACNACSSSLVMWASQIWHVRRWRHAASCKAAGCSRPVSTCAHGMLSKCWPDERQGGARCISRLDEMTRDLRNAARVMGDTALYEKMDEASKLIKRDVVFAASLYLA